ncbi:hypothetical protein pb186bvf_009019 [Paramecium bursaria]
MQQKIQQSVVKELLKTIDQQNINLIPEEKGLREFQWFELETKVRLLVFQLLESHMKEFVEQKSQFELIDLKLTKYVESFEQFRDEYFSSGKSLKIIQELKQDVSQCQEQVRQVQQINDLNFSDIKLKYDAILFQKEQLRNDLNQLNNNQSEIKQNIDVFKEQNQQFRMKLIQSMEQYKNEVQDSQLKMVERVSNQALRQDGFNHQICDSKEKFKIYVDKFQGMQDKLNQIQIQLQQQANQIGLHDRDMNKLDNIISRDQKTQNSISMMHLKLTNYENFIEKYMPLYIQGSISDTLHNTLDEQGLLKLAQYEEKRFTELHRIILEDDGKPNLERKINEFGFLIEKTQKRNQTILRDSKVSKPIVVQQDISSKQSYQKSRSSYTDSSDQVGIKCETFRFDKQELEAYIQEQVLQQTSLIEQNLRRIQTDSNFIDINLNMLQEKCIQQIEQLKNQVNEYATQQEKSKEIHEQFLDLPKYVHEITEIQAQQQITLQKLLQYQLIQSQKGQEEILVDGQVLNYVQADQLAEQIQQSIKFETLSPKRVRRINTQYTTNESFDESGDKKSVRIKTSTSLIKRQTASQERRRFCLLGSKIQQNIAFPDALMPRKQNSKLYLFLYMSHLSSQQNMCYFCSQQKI